MLLIMQAFQLTLAGIPYSADMKTGRPSKIERTEFGARLHAAREAAGLSQAQVADKLGITQAAYAFWERRPVALRADQVKQVAAILGVSTEQFFTSATKKRGNGPVGRARAVFERVSVLPRERRQKILGAVEDMLVAHEARKAS